MIVYEIRRGREVLCQSTIPFLGYTQVTIRGMLADGLSLYRDGVQVKLKDIR